MTQRHQRVAIGVVAVCFSALIAAACGDDKPADQNVGEAGSAGSSNAGAAGDGGGGTDGGTGGANSAGSAGSSSGSAGDGGSAGSVGVTAGNPDDVVHAACDWEFRCCDAGERAYRLSPFATTADSCASRLIFQMRESNATANPYVSGSAAEGALLGTLGYVVNLSRVEVSAEGVQACKTALDARGCATEPDPNARCAGPAAADPCALTNLFKPTLAIGAECTVALTEGAYNDVECVVGSTCLDAGHPDNPNPNVPTCVKRGLESEPCTLDADCDFNFFCGDGSCTEKGDANEVCSFGTPATPAPGDEDVQCKFGLSCNPATLHCVPSCTVGSTCATGEGDNDLACPAGFGCAPLLVAERTDQFRVCTALGTSAAALCNSDADCEATRYCDAAGVCQPDKGSTIACTAQNQCAAGLHCDTGNTGTCISNLAALAPCTESFQCGPTSAGCLNQGTTGLACRSNKLPNADECGNDAACASGRCELATSVATVTTCVAGAALNAACDNLTGIGVDEGDAQRCRPGLFCFGAAGTPAGGSCVQQASPGTDCNNPEANADVNMCANASGCDPQQWELDLCSDAPVAKTNGGTGLTCDGS